MSILSLGALLHKRGLAIGSANDFYKVQNNNLNAGKSVDLLVRETLMEALQLEADWSERFFVVSYLDRMENGEPRLTGVSAAQWPAWAVSLREQLYPTEPRKAMHRTARKRPVFKAFAAVGTSLIAVLEAAGGVVEGVVSALWQSLCRWADRWRKPKEPIKWKVHVANFNPRSLDSIAWILVDAARRLENGEMRIVSGGIMMAPPLSGGLDQGFTLSSDLVVEVIPNISHDWLCRACRAWNPDHRDNLPCPVCSAPRPDICEYRKHNQP